MAVSHSFAEELGDLNEWHFFREFVYSRTTFQPTPGREVELADNLVVLGDILIAYQLKQREVVSDATEETERRWFEKKVLGKATSQIRDTVQYLKGHDSIELRNARGHQAKVSFAAIRQFHKLVVYLPNEKLPTDCRSVKHHLSRTAGFIHVISGSDYLGIIQTLLTPAEVAEYLEFRERVVTRWSNETLSISEAMLVGQYISGELDSQPAASFLEYLGRLDHRADEWDMSGIINKFLDRVTTASGPDEYYPVISELALLRRDELREFKTRFQLSLQKARANEIVLPYRMVIPRTGCGFVFIPVTKELVEKRRVGLENYTLAHKYDQRLDKCIGVSIADDTGPWFTVEWCYTEFPWSEDPEMDRRLKENFPFREVKQHQTSRYSFDQRD